MIGVLGAARVGGTVLRSRGQRVVLAALCVEPGAVVSADRLAELVWHDDVPHNWAGALQSHVSRLRRVLPDDVDLVAEGAGYRLEGPGTEQIDAVLLARAHARATDAPTAADRLEHCDAGLAVWAAPPFEDLDDPQGLAERSRLTELAAGLRDMRVDALIALGRRTEAIAELETMRAADPLRERTAARLMHLLMAENRKRDALAVYAQLKHELVEELGLDPDAELRELHDAIVLETYAPPAGLTAAPSAPPRPSPDDDVPVRAGPRLEDLVGRRREMARVIGLLEGPGVVTLAGPGGVGKTRLALQVATSADFDRVDVVELAQLDDASVLADAVASELGIPAQPETPGAEMVADALRGRRRLLVLDNCEHVIVQAASFIDHVLRSGGDIRLLATSREPLDVDGESVVRLQPLDEAEAVELLRRRIAARGRECPGGAEVTELMRRVTGAVDGLPLGIELAAAHCDTMTLAEIAEALVEPLDLLARGRRTADERHRSLRSLVEWSVRDLDVVQREVFAHTAVFAGPFTAGALAVVTGRPRAQLLNVLADLVDRSLVASREGPGGRMLHSTMATVRAYALELLDASGDRAVAEARHDDWVLNLVEPMAADLAGWGEAERTQLVDVHLPDLRVAHRRFVDADDAARSVRFAVSLHHTAFHRMHAELFGWITDVAERFGSCDVPGTEAVLASAAVGAWEVGAMERSADLASRAVATDTASLRRGIGAPEALADLAGFGGDNGGAIRLFRDGLAAARAEGNECRVFCDLSDLAIHLGYAGDIDAARGSIDEARRLLGDSGPRAARAWLAYVEGEALAETDPEEAIVALRRAVDDAVATTSEFIVGVARLTLAGLQIRVGSIDDATDQLCALIRHWSAAGARLQQWITLRSVLSLLVERGADVPAAHLLGFLASEVNLAEIAGADAERLAVARRSLASRVGPEEFGAWRGRDVDDVVQELLGTLEGASTP